MPGMTALMYRRLSWRRARRASPPPPRCISWACKLLWSPPPCLRMRGHEEIVKLLLSVDVPTDVVDTSGQDSITWADERGHTRVAILGERHMPAETGRHSCRAIEFRREQQQRRRPGNVPCEMPHDKCRHAAWSQKWLCGRSVVDQRRPVLMQRPRFCRGIAMSSKKAIVQDGTNRPRSTLVPGLPRAALTLVITVV